MVRIPLIVFAALVAIACNPENRQNINAPDATAAAVTAVVTVRSLSITGAPPVSGGTSQLTATASFSDGSSRNVTNQAKWETSDETILMVSSTGIATGVKGGQAIARASYEGANAVLDLNIVIALPPPINPAEIFNCEKQGDDASDLKRTLYIASYPRATVSQVDLGFTARKSSGLYSVKLTVLANKAQVGEKTLNISVFPRPARASASFVFTPALNIPPGASVRFVAAMAAGPIDGELSWEGTTDSKCPVIVTPDETATDPAALAPKIPVRVLGF